LLENFHHGVNSMCIKLSKNDIMNYTSNFLSGIVGSLVIVFALGQENQLNNFWLFIATIILYFVGLVSISIFKSIALKKK